MQAIDFTDARDFVLYRPGPAEDEVADIIAKAVGHLGSMADYLLDTVTHLEQAGIHDPHLRRMQALVAERLERM